VNKIEYSIIFLFLIGFTSFLAVLALIIFAVHKKASHNLSNNNAQVNGYACLFPCPLKVSNIILAMNLIAFCKTAEWSNSLMFLKNGTPDFWVDRK
jgi:hypothetical protein